MDYGGFGKKSGPTSSTNPSSAQQFFSNVAPSPPNPRFPVQQLPRPFVQSAQSFGDGQRPFGHNVAQSQGQRPSSSPPVVKSIVKSRRSENSGYFKVSRSQQENSQGFNSPVPTRNNLSSGGFRPTGVVPIRQLAHPRTNSPQLSYNHVVENFRSSNVAQPVRPLARPRNSSPEIYSSGNKPFDLDNFPPLSVGAGPARHTARPRSKSPELAFRSNQFVDLDSFPLSDEVGPTRHTAHPRANAPDLASRSNQFVDLDSFPPLPIGAGSVHHIARPRSISPELTSRSNQFSDYGNPPPPSAGAGLAHYTSRSRTNSPEQARHQFVDLDGFPPSGAEPIQPTPFRNSSVSPARSPVSYANLQTMQNHPPDSSYYGLDSSQHDDVQATNQTRSPTSQTGRIPHLPQNNSKRSSFMHNPALDTITNVKTSTHDSQAPRKTLPQSSNHVPGATATTSISFPAMKRSRSPPMFSNKAPTGKFNDIQDDEREMQAKAKRLARFKVELGESQSVNDDIEPKVSTSLHEVSIVGRSKLVSENSTEMNDGVASELEGSSMSGVIMGLCTDMCPESERGERERKGDLDRFERLDGDRNRTSKYLAVKKYTRTAEREAILIRPMPILQKTMEYLLNLLDQPYNDKFLVTYNFLWDRMRAIRMDLRMQHIFNQAAITMLEQMIRLHIIVMHELCEYSKGEGFSEGFDAHLNIEQMNKTSVELFQMYDDHRKKGIAISTEEEFRGYYALLKLDKHPGYMVEPAELSLDLAKMTPEIRQTKEVLFARDVARACRTGNFIAFFRLARKASYLQACLMHAHFAKLRTQALASLHAGLQINQGLPVIHVAKWLAMEEEDMESLLEYHGFVIKAFDEPYMVKDGQFLNGDKDYDTRCSKLVDMKKSELIVDDVRPSKVKSPTNSYQRLGKNIVPTDAPKEIKMVKKSDNELEAFTFDGKKKPVNDSLPIEDSTPVYTNDEDMENSEGVPSPKGFKVIQPMREISAPSQQHENDHQLPGSNPFSWDFSLPEPLQYQGGNKRRPSNDTPFGNFSHGSMQTGIVEAIPLQAVSRPIVQYSFLDAPSNFAVEKSEPQALVTEEDEDEEAPVLLEEIRDDDNIEPDYEEEEIAEAKLKLILRSWKRRASRKKEVRERKQLASITALNSLPLGPLVQLKREPLIMLGEFDIDHASRERFRKHELSQSRLNVSEEIADVLSENNPAASCLCWKIVVLSQLSKPNEAEKGQTADCALNSWLLSKLMPSNDDNDDDLLVSSSGLTVWKKWVSDQFHSDQTCCLSVIKEVNFNNPIFSESGSNAVIFLVFYSIPWSQQKANLQRLLESIPPGSRLPLLIASSFADDVATNNHSVIINELGLLGIDKSRISSFVVVSLVENQQTEISDGFFSDDRLREGLRWLASESPSQLVLRRVKTRELVLTHLSPTMESLEGMKGTEVSPNDCVLAFNDALDRSLVLIDDAAKANPTAWPCPEISLIDKSCFEHSFLKGRMPENGWSSAERIEPLVSLLQNCKLPVFELDLSYLLEGSNAVGELEIQRLNFGKSLITYLTKSSNLMILSLAVKEAEIMLQSCRLELRGSYFHIVPNWTAIFRRIFNWRLMSLAGDAFSSAYILEHTEISPAFDGPNGSELKGYRISSYHINQPTLDDMIEVSFRSAPLSTGHHLPGTNQALIHSAPSNHEAQEISCLDVMEDDSEADRVHNEIREVVAIGKVNNEADRFDKLIEKCTLLQNMIDKKLCVYF